MPKKVGTRKGKSLTIITLYIESGNVLGGKRQSYDNFFCIFSFDNVSYISCNMYVCRNCECEEGNLQ